MAKTFSAQKIARGEPMHGKDISKGEVGRHHRTHSTVKVDSGSDPKVIHETQNSNGEKGHTTSRPDGGIHNQWLIKYGFEFEDYKPFIIQFNYLFKNRCLIESKYHNKWCYFLLFSYGY